MRKVIAKVMSNQHHKLDSDQDKAHDLYFIDTQTTSIEFGYQEDNQPIMRLVGNKDNLPSMLVPLSGNVYIMEDGQTISSFKPFTTRRTVIPETDDRTLKLSLTSDDKKPEKTISRILDESRVTMTNSKDPCAEFMRRLQGITQLVLPNFYHKVKGWNEVIGMAVNSVIGPAAFQRTAASWLDLQDVRPEDTGLRTLYVGTVHDVLLNCTPMFELIVADIDASAFQVKIIPVEGDRHPGELVDCYAIQDSVNGKLYGLPHNAFSRMLRIWAHGGHWACLERPVRFTADECKVIKEAFQQIGVEVDFHSDAEGGSAVTEFIEMKKV